MLERQCTDWQFTREDLKRTPSVSCGWTVEREELDRAKACSLIYSASRKLQLPQITSASACAYLHRFFMRHTLKEYHHYNIAATCLFFACKAEESLRKLEIFIPVIVYYASKGNRRAPPGTSEFEKWRTVILRTEVVLLQALCFDMVIDHPHVALIDLATTLSMPRRLTQMAWNFIADCMRLPLCLVYAPKAIACASVVLATKVSSADTSDIASSLLDSVWAEKAGIQKSTVDEIVQWLLSLYAREAQARKAASHSNGGVVDHSAEAAQTPAYSPAPSASPMTHIHPSPSSDLK
ncbi:hypothetical protein IW140_001474 [Coemansia sp. RSA 1813]|nr:hypothetical protein EV178_003287 [Coemansia sp. RSA 1646]KAJ1771546.1 hypothetical protein LPJ74_002234 [Coemansia sp. RSA 1843]KAJ2089594.1 hypothetical protein IW138_003336 [Coemansia sp. RSA 986]KAJ2214697.1 hypothetical protein EV179_002802 [Coemansia sp. RSA 487]KAJ2571556.1 hypothetical protein IW140_001474 [Coemansia sp. RSA 1813]